MQTWRPCHYKPFENIMEFTINRTRVPIPQETTLYGTPLDIGSSPDSSGSVSYNDTSVLN